MLEVTERKKDQKTQALLIGVEFPNQEDENILLDELAELVKTVGIEVVAKKCISIKAPQARYLMGTGKAEEIFELLEALECDMLIFDNELTPAQQRNWEVLTNVPVADRQAVILEIFSQRARTKEAVLQVELAQQEYFLPRLKRAWTHLSRQKGGGAMARGMGEKQIEVDSRIVRDRIAKLKRELKEVIKQRATQRRQRQRVPLPTAAIVGYTNAGKSSLLNALTDSDVLAEDKLFATLDPTTKRLKLPNGQILLVTDTVGFVRKLPHNLVDAFKATLEETLHADFLIHVADITSKDLEQHIRTTTQVMRELGAQDKKVLMVFNKVDAIEDNAPLINRLQLHHEGAIFVSALTNEGIPALLREIEVYLETLASFMQLLIPHDRYDLINKLHKMGAVKTERAEEEGVYVTGNIPRRLLKEVEAFKV